MTYSVLKVPLNPNQPTLPQSLILFITRLTAVSTKVNRFPVLVTCFSN